MPSLKPSASSSKKKPLKIGRSGAGNTSATPVEKSRQAQVELKSRLREEERREKAAEEARKRRQKALAAPRTVQDAIMYLKQFEDGGCEVAEETYTVTYEFTDVNYQTSRPDDQKSSFSRYCEMLHLLDPSTQMQLTLMNRQLDEETFEQNVFLPMKDDGFDHFRKELNSNFERTSAEGKRSISRRRLLTLSKTAPTYTAAAPALARSGDDFTQALRNLGSTATKLDGFDRLEILNNVFWPDDQFVFDYTSLLKSSLTTKDIIAPPSFDFSMSDSFEYGQYCAQVMTITNFPPTMTDKFLADLCELPVDFIFSLHIRKVETADAMELVKQKIGSMNAQKSAATRKSREKGRTSEEAEASISDELQFSLEEAYDLRDSLKKQNQCMFVVTPLVMTYARNYDELVDNLSQIRGVIRKNTCKALPLDLVQREALNSVLPLGLNRVNVERTMTTWSTAIFMPFTTQELTQGAGSMYYGQNALTHNFILANRKNLKAPNGFYLGRPGGGKSFASKREIINVLLQEPDDDVIVIDIEREYTKLGEAFGATNIQIGPGSANHINPFDLNEDYGDGKDPVKFKSDLILSLCDMLVDGLTPVEKSLLDRVNTLTYATKLDLSAGTQGIPTFPDFHDMLTKQNHASVEDLAIALDLYVNGSFSTFSHPTDVNTENRFLIYDIHQLGKQMITPGMLIVLDQIWNRITRNRALGKRTWIYIDEFQMLLSNEYSSRFFFELWTRARKYGALPTALTQNVETVLMNEDARRSLSNSEFIYMLDQAQSDRRALADLLEMSERQLGYVTDAQAGHGLLFFGGAVVPFKDKFPSDTELYKLMTTKPEEVAPVK